MESRRSLPTIFLFTVVVVACSASATTAEKVSPQRAAQVIAEAPPGLTVLDVRTPAEFDGGHLAEAINVDYLSADFRGRMAGFDRTLPYVMYCRSGNRSADARAVMADSPLRWSTQTHPSDRRTGVSERRMTSVSHGQVPSRGRLGGAPSERPMGSGSHRGGC